MSQFIDKYIKVVSNWTDAPEEYHYGVSLSILGAAFAGKVWLPYAQSTTNLWVLLLGSAEEDRKSTCIRYGKRIISSCVPERVASDPGSYEALIKLLSGPLDPKTQTSPAQKLLIYSEFQSLMDRFTLRYAAPLQATLNDLYDWSSVPYVRELMNRTFTLNGTAISLLGGCTPEHIEKRANEEFWRGGFFSRILPIIAHKTRFLDEENIVPAEYKDLVTSFGNVVASVTNPIELEWTPKAHSIYSTWVHGNADRQVKSHPIIRSLMGRIALNCKKIAAIRALDVSGCNTHHVGSQALDWTINFVEQLVVGIETLPTSIAFTDDMRKKRSIVNLLKSKGGTLAYSTLLRNSNMKARELQEFLETLMAEGTATREGKNVFLQKEKEAGA